jgi:acyl-CoA synthetase (AMP-forming)/AMP-acid ligase II
MLLSFYRLLRPGAFRPNNLFGESVERIANRLKAVEPAKGFEEVLLPGEPEVRARDQRLREGIPLPDACVDLCLALLSFNVFPEPHKAAGEIRRFCFQRLAPYKVPKDIVEVKVLDKTASGKLRRS